MGEVINEDTVFVAVGNDAEKSKLTLVWALQNLNAKDICFLHVHQPLKPQVDVELLSRSEAAHQEILTNRLQEKMFESLKHYNDICNQSGVDAREIVVEMDDVGEGIVALVYQHSVKKLVMGAAADTHYSGGMTDIKSRKANYVRQLVPLSCHIWFVCGGHLIHTGEGDFDRSESSDVEASRSSSSSQASSFSEAGPSNASLSSGSNAQPQVPFEQTEVEENELQLLIVPPREEDNYRLPSSSIQGRAANDEIYVKLEEVMAEAEKSKKEALDESIKRYKAEKSAIETIRGVRALESMYAEECRRRKEAEETISKEKEEFEKMKQQINEDRLISMDQKLLMENQVATSDFIIKELNDKIASDQEQLQLYQTERDSLQEERDTLLKLTEDLLKKQLEEESTSSMSVIDQFFSEFTVSDIRESTTNFDPSIKIAEGSNGSVYKGSLYRTPVAIKVMHTNSLSGPLEFQQEVNIYSKLRHPNLTTFIGVCPEIWALVFEYVPNGSLEDRLNCKDDTPPLSWQDRIRIATELCSVLIFLHKSSPEGIVHGNLNPGNILLDANLVCKLIDFRYRRVYSSEEESSSNHETDPNGYLDYVDPQSHTVGSPSPKSDVYSFGIILLQLLMGTRPFSVLNEMQGAIEEGDLNAFLDPSAGDWPLVQAEQWAHLAMRCCEINLDRRPDLASEVWRVLELVKASCGEAFTSTSAFPSYTPSPSVQQSSEEQSQPPSYFICPILQDVMREPHFAADGFTYESEALMDWLESGHDTSPMTNLQLPHRNLVPNRSLRSAIQEWLQQPQQQQH